MNDRIGRSPVTAFVVGLIAIMALVVGVVIALLYKDSPDATAILTTVIGFAGVIVTNIVMLAKQHDVQKKVDEVKDNVIPKNDTPAGGLPVA